jgi:hypothetical protein
MALGLTSRERALTELNPDIDDAKEELENIDLERANGIVRFLGNADNEKEE